MALKKDSILNGWYTIVILLLLMLMVVVPISVYPNLDQVPDDLIDSVVVASGAGSYFPITTKTVAGISQTLSKSTSTGIVRVTTYFDGQTVEGLFKDAGVPSVTGITPASGPVVGGTDVTITGTGFTGAVMVNFGTEPATSVKVTSDMIIKATSPAHASGVVDVTVITPGGTSPVVTAGEFTYVDKILGPLIPVVTGVLPEYGQTAGGTKVTITGSGFTGATVVNFGTVPAISFTITSDTEIKATSPASTAGIVDLTVTTPEGTSAIVAADQFTYSDEIPVPEFPITGLPAVLIISMLGVIHLIRRSREN